ncbi:MAG: excinuclease ABC subunit B [Gemmatimonadetes bacterium]|nr:UvrB/UvrC motif-containing protein [Gemmatimonadota bacterium]NNM06822.1 excinuclease ABC subunit B [Gemmatimonadota bacterium]
MASKDPSEKVCDSCGEPGAVVHLTQVVNNETTTSHLCEKCAAEKGVHTSVPVSPSNLPLADFLAKMGGEDPPEAGGLDQDLSCPFCGLSTKDFREVGRLGCPQCYPTFEEYLRGLLRRIHGGTTHVGKVYLPPDPSVSDREKKLAALRRKLSRAVESEDFERAATLRDEIRALEPAS